MSPPLTWIAAVLAGLAVFLIATHRRTGLSERLERYLTVPEAADDRPARPFARLIPAAPWVVGGVFIGVLLAQGDLFIAGPGRSVPALAMLGGAAGWFAWSAHGSNERQRRSDRLRFELPVVTDALAMQVVSGESISTAIGNVCDTTTGVASDEMRAALRSTEGDKSLSEALVDASRSSAHPDGRRLYESLSHAHQAGGRLGESLAGLSADFRASIERDLTAEGGKRAITSYGPILALMVPTALLFLLYPTLLGLKALSGAP